MGFGRFNPDCLCCDVCVIYSDDFNRADSTTITADWVESSGAWSITSNEVVTSSDNALAYYNTAHPSARPSHILRVRIKGEDATDELRAVVALTDANNYLYAQVTIGDSTTCGELELYSVSGGVHTRLRGINVPNLVADNWYTVHVCYYKPSTLSSGTFAAWVTGSGGTVLRGVSSTATATGQKVGLGTGAIVTTAHFDNFIWQDHEINEVTDPYETPNPECGSCANDLLACKWGGTTSADCMWSQDSGVWTITQTSSSNGRYTLSQANPLDSTRLSLQGEFAFTASGDVFEFRICVKDASTYLAARFTSGSTCGQIDLIQDGSIIDTLAVEPMGLLDTHWACVSYDGAYLRCDFLNGSRQATLGQQALYRHQLKAVTPDTAGTKVALATGTVTGTITFDVEAWFAYSDEFPECPSCVTCHVQNADDADIDTNCEWDPISGSVVTGGLGVAMSAINDLAAYKAAYGGDMFLVVTLQGTAAGQKLRVYLNDDGTGSSGAWFELEFGTTSGTLRDSDGSSTTWPATLNSTHTLKCCLFGVRMLTGAYVAGVQDYASLVSSLASAPTGKYITCQLLGANGSAYFSVDGGGPLTVDKDWWTDDAVTCQRCHTYCDSCKDQQQSASYEIVLDNISSLGAPNDPNGCCPGYEGTYYTDQSGDCYATYEESGCSGGAPCSCFDLTVSFTPLVSQVRVEVTLYHQPEYPAAGGTITWRKDVDRDANGDYDCTAISNLSLDYYSYTGPQDCSAASSTCVLSSA